MQSRYEYMQAELAKLARHGNRSNSGIEPGSTVRRAMTPTPTSALTPTSVGARSRRRSPSAAVADNVRRPAASHNGSVGMRAMTSSFVHAQPEPRRMNTQVRKLARTC